MSTEAVATFVKQLHESQLLDAAQLAEVERLRPAADRPAALASQLVKRGWMTTYQANQVARGRGGELVLGAYVILEPLGQGGMGQVVKAQHRYMQRQVALKYIRRDLRDSAETIERFHREVRLLGQMRHPHIVHAYDAGNIGDVWYFAMELLDGVDLSKLVHQRGALPLGDACTYIRQAALGLQHAHERGLVHRDIKPSNLFLTDEGIKLLDLGLARPPALGAGEQQGDLTRANSVMGTPDYLAPEQALDPRRADARSDLYSLGCTFYFLLAGRPPFPEGSLAQKLLFHQQAEPSAVETLRDDVPSDLVDLFRKLLAKSKEQRPASAAEVANQLAPFAGSVATETYAANSSGGNAAVPLTGKHAVLGAPPSSLIDSKVPAPERGFTLMTDDSISQASDSSLIDSKVPAQERGFTLTTDPSLSAAPAPSLADSNAPAPAGEFSLVLDESVAPIPAPLQQLGSSETFGGGPTPHAEPISRTAVTSFGPPPELAQRRMAILVSAALGGFLLLVLVTVGALWLGGVFSSRADSSGDSALAEKQKGSPGNDLPKQPQNDAKVKPKPSPLAANGPKETERVFLLPTIAPDAELANVQPGAEVYLSDMNEFAFKTTPTNWKFAKNGLVGDPGNPSAEIQVNGKKYPKGLGMHPPNTGFIRICYALGRCGATLQGAVALDDGNHPPWRIKTTYFAVIGDGKVLWRSQGISTRGVVEPFTVDVRGVAVLELRVYTDYNGANGSRAVWLDPYVVVCEPQHFDDSPPREKKVDAGKLKPPRVLEPMGPQEKLDPAVKPFDVDPQLARRQAGSRVFLTEMKDFAYKGNPGEWVFGKYGHTGDSNNTRVQVNGKLYPEGLGTHPPLRGYTRVCYALGGRASSLHGGVAIADTKEIWSAKPTRFVIFADGKIIWRSNIIKSRGVSEAFDLDVREVNVLELRAYVHRALHTGAHAVWLDPYVIVE